MPKSIRAKSAARRPLSDISNGRKPSRPCKKSLPAGDDEGVLDCLLVTRSDLAGLISQIDELVAYAINQKTISKNGSQVIQSFSYVLTNMHSSLKMWLPRFHQVFDNSTTASEARSGQPKDTDITSCPRVDVAAACTKQNEPQVELIVSPSPLVSWRAGACKVKSGRQLFMLTPLPKSKLLASKQLASFKNGAEISSDMDRHDTSALSPLLAASRSIHYDLLDGREVKQASNIAPEPGPVRFKSKPEGWLVSPMNFTVHSSSVYPPTPCSKTTLAMRHASDNGISTPRDQEHKNMLEPTQTESGIKVPDDDRIEEVSQKLASRYQELIDLLPTDKFTSHGREVDGTLDWFLSPPKTCVLMEPSDEKVLLSPHLLPTPAKGVLLATPMWKDFKSTVRKGKQPGENTLKKELWAKFEAVSMSGLHFDASVSQKTTKKGFLDMLEEASSVSTDLDPK